MSTDDRSGADPFAPLLDRATHAFRGQLIAELRPLLDEQERRAAEERARAVDAAVAELNVEHAKARRRTDAEIDMLRRTLEVARRDAAAGIESAQRLGQAHVEETQHAAEARLQEVRDELARVRRELDGALAQVKEVRATAVADAEQMVIAQLAIVQAETERSVKHALEQARFDQRQAELAHAARLRDAIRDLDAARSLGEILDVLGQSASREVERAAVLLVKTERLHGWHFAGFPDLTASARSLTLSLAEAGVAGAVVRTRTPLAYRSAADTPRDGMPLFARDTGDRQALAVPVTVGGSIVAVLYADTAAGHAAATGAWPAVLELLARHASRALEALTLQQAAGLAIEPSATSAPYPSLPGPVEQGQAEDEDAARRYARLLLSEVRLFNERLLDDAYRSGDLRTHLGGEIERARRSYEGRIPASVSRRREVFEQELIRTLAEGERASVGGAS